MGDDAPSIPEILDTILTPQGCFFPSFYAFFMEKMCNLFDVLHFKYVFQSD